jgi:hypothetical protein
MAAWLGCSHKKIAFPITRPKGQAQGRRKKNTYVVCLECGKELPYSWSEMRVVKERRRTPSVDHNGRPSVAETANLDSGTIPAKLLRSRHREI